MEIVGDNGRGKTNILEAIYVLLTGKPKRASKYVELVRWGQVAARVSGILVPDKMDQALGIQRITLPEFMTKDSIHGDAESVIIEVHILPEGRAKYMVNGVARQRRVFARQMDVVWFGPEDLALISGSAAKRREYMDELLSGIDEEYDRCLGVYEQSIRRRNKLLMAIREGMMTREILPYWDQQIISSGSYLQKKRRALVLFLERFSPSTWTDIRFSVSYDCSEISSSRLQQYSREEVAAGTTLVGPHRDELLVRYENGDGNHVLRLYGSRGQQRMGALWLKLAELEYIESVTGRRPLLLLDDVLSELDEVHQRYVHEIMGKQQTVSTGLWSIDARG